MSVIKKLNDTLSDQHIWYQNLRNFHWNVSGRQFFELHAKFEELYKKSFEDIDRTAERIKELKGWPLVKYSDYLKNSRITESSTETNEEIIVKALIHDAQLLCDGFEEVIIASQENDDYGTEDIFSEFLHQYQHEGWMLSQFL